MKAVIPACYNFVGLPSKLLLDLFGKPIGIHVADRFRSALPAVGIWVSADGNRRCQTVEDYEYCSLMTSLKHKLDSDRVAEVVQKLE